MCTDTLEILVYVFSWFQLAMILLSHCQSFNNNLFLFISYTRTKQCYVSKPNRDIRNHRIPCNFSSVSIFFCAICKFSSTPIETLALDHFSHLHRDSSDTSVSCQRTFFNFTFFLHHRRHHCHCDANGKRIKNVENAEVKMSICSTCTSRWDD